MITRVWPVTVYGNTMTDLTRTRSRNSGTSSYLKNNFSDTMTDVVVENFEKRRDAGELICNSASWDKVRANAWTGNAVVVYDETKLSTGVTVRYTQTLAWAKYYWVPNNGAHPYWANLARAKVVNEALMDLKTSDPSAYDFAVAMTAVSSEIASGIAQTLVTLAESKKTLGMLCKAVRLLKTPVRVAMMGLGITYRRLKADPQARIRVMEKAAELWMEARYGWRPFVYDTIAHAEAFMAMDGAGGRLTKKNLVQNWNDGESVKLNTMYFSSSNKLQLDLNVEKSFKADWRCGQTADFHEMFTGPMRLFGIFDPVGTGWELIPFSWVVDKFLNLREMALSIQAYVMCSERIGWHTTYVSAEAERFVTFPQGRGPKSDGVYSSVVVSCNHDSGTNSGRETVASCIRTKITDFSPVMGVQDSLKWEEYVDLTALLAVLTNRFRPKSKGALPW